MRWPIAWTVSGLIIIIVFLGFSSIILAEDGKWTKKADMPTPRWSFSTSVANRKIYAIGGEANTGLIVPTVEEYDPVIDK